MGRNLEEERIWEIDQGVRERFNAKSLYELALREDIPWRQWNHWVREKIVAYLRENKMLLQQRGRGDLSLANHGNQKIQSQPYAAALSAMMVGHSSRTQKQQLK